MMMESVSGEHSDFRPPAKTARSRLIVFLTLTLFTCSDQLVSQPWTVSGQRNVTWIHDARHHQTNRLEEVSSTVHVQQEDRSHLVPPTATRHPRYQWSTDSDRQQEMTSSDARTRRLPDVIIIGVKKCGTRALLEFIRAHPHVRATGHEVHFFDRHYDKGLDWYRSRMPMTSRDQLTVEKTPSYFVSASVAQRVYNMSRDIRLLVVVRDPVTRALSDFTQAQFKRRRRRQSFHPDVNLDTDRRSSFERRAFIDAEHNVIDTSWSAIDIGLYERHARHWLEVFPRQQIHFVDGEQLITDPAAQLFNVQTFLGLPPLITERNFYFNKTKGFPCLVRRPRTSDESVHCLGKTKGRTHPTVYVEVLKKLRDFYRPYNAKFYELTGDNFGWE